MDRKAMFLQQHMIIIRIILSLSHRRLEKQRTVRQYGVAEFADMNM